LTAEGKIPRNDYGNIELFNGPLPATTMYLNVFKITGICKKLDLDCVPAVVRFDKAGNGMSIPVIEGAVVFIKDKDAIEYQAKIDAMKAEENLRRKVEKEARRAWKLLIRSLLISKYLRDQYG